MGDWNLSPWAYSGNNISTPTVNSNGSAPIGLSATMNSPVMFFLLGEPDGMVSLAIPFAVPPGALSSYSLTQSLRLSAPVDFGIPSSQSQFVDTITDNGVGIRIKSEEAIYIAHYNLTISLSGGGVFSSVGGDYDGFGDLAGLGTSTITFEWIANAPIDGAASFEGIQISGGITGFSVMHDVVYSNDSFVPLNLTNIIEIKINTTESTMTSGDFDHDGDVDRDDLLQWQGDFGQNGFSDADADGDSDGADFLAWQRNVSGSASAAANIPEPAAGALALLGALGLLVHRTRRTPC